MNWISVKERLPEADGQFVIVKTTQDSLFCNLWPARWSKTYQNFEAGGGWFEQDEVTHWMPLPEPPRE